MRPRQSYLSSPYLRASLAAHATTPAPPTCRGESSAGAPMLAKADGHCASLCLEG